MQPIRRLSLQLPDIINPYTVPFVLVAVVRRAEQFENILSVEVVVVVEEIPNKKPIAVPEIDNDVWPRTTHESAINPVQPSISKPRDDSPPTLLAALQFTRKPVATESNLYAVKVFVIVPHVVTLRF